MRKIIVTLSCILLVGCGTTKAVGVSKPVSESSIDSGSVKSDSTETKNEDSKADGKVDYDKLRPIMFDISSMSYRVIGPVVGKAYHDGLALKK